MGTEEGALSESGLVKHRCPGTHTFPFVFQKACMLWKLLPRWHHDHYQRQLLGYIEHRFDLTMASTRRVASSVLRTHDLFTDPENENLGASSDMSRNRRGV